MDNRPHRTLLRRRWEPCPLCGSGQGDEVYRALQHTGAFGGRLETRLVMCRDCDFVFSNPRPDEESLRRFYDADPNASGQVYRRTGPGSAAARLAASHLAFIREHAPNTMTLLDMGCGGGAFLHEASAHTPWRLTGVDPSSAAAERARRGGLNILRANLDEALAALPPHETITMFGVLEHLREPVEFLSRLAGLLATGGRLVVEVPDSTRPVASLVEFFDFEHLGHFTLATVERMFARAGWRLTVVSDAQRQKGRLLVCAGRDDDPTLGTAPAVDHTTERHAVLNAIVIYRREKRALERDFQRRLKPALARWRRQGARVAIYGAGLHTDYLLGCCPELEPTVVCLLDSDPGKQGRTKGNWHVHGPGDIAGLELDAILVSTMTGEADVLADLAKLGRAGVEVLGCYSGAPIATGRRP